MPTKYSKNENGKYYDFDLQVLVLQLFRLDVYSSEMWVVDDSNEIWFTQIQNLRYKNVRQGDFVRIRSANLEQFENYQNTFGFKPHSNIMILN